MRIVQIITRMDDVGGAQIHVRDLSSELKKTGHKIYIITGKNENVHEAIEENEIKLINSKNLIRNLNPISDIKAIIEIRKYLKEIQPDIVATHSSKAGIIGRIAGWSLRIPTIFTAHGWSYTDGVSRKRKKFYVFIERVIGKISDGVITVSEYDRQLALKHKVLPEDKVYTIHNGVHDVKRMREDVIINEIPNMIMVARFAAPKQQIQLLEVLNHIKDIPWKITFAGDGPLLSKAKNYVKHMKLENRVSFLGNRDDVNELLCKADLFVLVSDWEGLPLSILEAMRCGLPIIASDVGGVKEAVIHNKNGFLIPTHNPEELKEKLLEVLTNNSLRNNMGRESQKIYESNFKFEKMYNHTLGYYGTVIQKNTRITST